MEIKERIALNRDRTRAVPYASPEAAYLLASEGQEIPDALAEQYGIVDGIAPDTMDELTMPEPPESKEPPLVNTEPDAPPEGEPKVIKLGLGGPAHKGDEDEADRETPEQDEGEAGGQEEGPSKEKGRRG